METTGMGVEDDTPKCISDRSSTSDFVIPTVFFFGAATKGALVPGTSAFCALTGIPSRECRSGASLSEGTETGALPRRRHCPVPVCSREGAAAARRFAGCQLPPAPATAQPPATCRGHGSAAGTGPARGAGGAAADPRASPGRGARMPREGGGGAGAGRGAAAPGRGSSCERGGVAGGAAGNSSSALPPASPGAAPLLRPPLAAAARPPGAAPAPAGPGRGRGAESLAVPGRAMGFDPSRFAAPVAAELQCKLCGRVLEEPLSTPCGHVFCAGCLLPWAARRRRCPLRCRPLAAAELRPVLPLRSLVQKLEVKCDYSPRGCGRTVRLRELPAHLAACRYGPPPPGPAAEPEPRGRPPPGRSGGGSAGQPRRPAAAAPPRPGQRCPRALRGGGGPEPGPELKREALRWSRREKSLLAQLSALQSEVQLTARRYQAKFGQYMSHISSIARDLAGSQPGTVSAAPGPAGQHGPARSPPAMLSPDLLSPCPACKRPAEVAVRAVSPGDRQSPPAPRRDPARHPPTPPRRRIPRAVRAASAHPSPPPGRWSHQPPPGTRFMSVPVSAPFGGRRPGRRRDRRCLAAALAGRGSSPAWPAGGREAGGRGGGFVLRLRAADRSRCCRAGCPRQASLRSAGTRQLLPLSLLQLGARS
ncbi:unnamed protein product [Bubo scandiacus]